jgi:hypothetical protein
MRGLCLVLVLALTLGCAYGSGATRSVDDAPTVAVTGAPEGAILYVDGMEFGLASRFTAATPVEVIPGVHVVEIRQGAAVLHSEKIYSGTGSMTNVTMAGAE